MTCARLFVYEYSSNFPISVKKNPIVTKKYIFNTKGNTLRSHYNSEKNYFSYNRVVNMANIAFFDIFNLNFLKILT